MELDSACLRHFGLLKAPFSGVPERRFLWPGKRFLEALAHLVVGVEEKKGVLLLVGAPGSGKSLLLDCLLQVVGGRVLPLVLSAPGLSTGSFRAYLAVACGLEGEEVSGRGFLLSLRDFLRAARARGENPLLVLENASTHEDEVLEQARLLSNFEEENEPLLTLLLAGDRALDEKLATEPFRPLLQRVAVRCLLEPLTAEETAAYIRHRLMAAGLFLEIFDPGAAAEIARLTAGNPRRIDRLCTHALALGFAEGRRAFTAEWVRKNALRLGEAPPPEEGGGGLKGFLRRYRHSITRRLKSIR